MRVVDKPLLLALAAVMTLLAVQTQPAAGQRSSEIVAVTDLGAGAREAWVVLPNEPPSCLVLFLHPASAPTAADYLPWLDYLATGLSCAVIFPRYQVAARAEPVALDDLRAGISAGVVHIRRARFGFERRRASSTLRTVVVGVGLGGSLAFYYATNARRWGLPVPAAIDSILPSRGQIRGLPLGSLDRSTRVLVQASADPDADREAANDLRAYLKPHPATRKRFQMIRSNPGLKATEKGTREVSPAAVQTFWSPLDALIDGAH